MEESSKDKNLASMSATLEFDVTGKLRAVYLNAKNTADQAVLEKSLHRFLRPDPFSRIRRLLHWEG